MVPGIRLLACVLLSSLMLQSGCVNRRMTIRTIPTDALVEIDGQRKGLSPVSTDFTHYGTHEITVSAPGYETLTIQQPVRTPWYQKFPIDFFSNHFLFGHVTDRHDFTYQLQPKQDALDQETDLHGRAFNFRSMSQGNAARGP